jgi:Zn-dependent protease
MMKLLLGLLAAGKLGKVALTGGTMLLSVFGYALVFGWPYAVGFVALIFVHEMGHFIAARKCGLQVGAPVFIPFVGAWVALKDTELDPETEAFVAMAGPLVGTVGAFVTYLIASANGERLWYALAYAGFFINLFNLIPLRPLDGGRIVRVVSAKMWLIGVPILVAVFFWRPSPLLLLLAILAAPEVWAAIRGRGQDERLAAVPLASKLRWGAAYLGLALVLAVMAFEAHERIGASH